MRSLFLSLMIMAPVLLGASLAGSENKERVWIDTDAACNGRARIDPDDCLAIYALLQHGDFEVVGISATFGNASQQEVFETLNRLADILSKHGLATPEINDGAGKPLLSRPSVRDSQGSAASALCGHASSDLTILALGPLTNMASAIRQCPERMANVSRVVFVGGRREGHVFHPAEDKRKQARLGHGPIFRDFNVALDHHAARIVLESDIELLLAPYELARQFEITLSDVNTIREQGVAGEWLAERLLGWPDYWRNDIGRDGFYPFDLVAVAALLKPDALECAPVSAEIRRDRKIGMLGSGPISLVIAPVQEGGPSSMPIRTKSVLACFRFSDEGDSALRNLFFGESERHP